MSRQNRSTGRGYSAVVPTPLPFLPAVGLFINDEHLVGVEFLLESHNTRGLENEISRQFTAWLDQYLASPCGSLPDIKLSMRGTPFQRQVWHALQGIACGERVTYGELARQLGSGAQAVAAACRANPLPLVVPCHRVVSASGVGGYMGEISGPAIEIKRGLLQHESR